MSDQFEKYNQLNLIVSVEDVFDYMGAQREKEDGFKVTYSCPYHSDDLPSLLVDTRTGKFNCFACECKGQGAYSCAKYYLTHQNNKKPTAMMVVDHLCEINIEVEQYKYLFSVRTQKAYDYDQNKRGDFGNRVKIVSPNATLATLKKSMNSKQRALYVDAIMTGMPDEFIIHALGMKSKKILEEGSEAFLSLLGE